MKRSEVPSGREYGRIVRKHAGALLAAGIGVATFLTLAGCAGIPTPADVRDEFALRKADLMRWKDEALRNCAGNVNPAQCKSDVLSDYTRLDLELLQAKNKAIDQLWDEAKRLRDLWDQELRQKFRELGIPNLKSFLGNGLITTDITLVSEIIVPMRGASGNAGGATSSGAGGIYYEPPCVYESIDVNGTASLDRGGTQVAGAVHGTMLVCWDTMAEPGTVRGQLISGEIEFWAAYPPIVLTLDTTAVRILESNDSGGGRIQAWFKVSIPSTPWAAIMRDSVYLDLPLTYSAQDGFVLTLEGAPVDSLVPRYRSPFSDYNQDGVYNHAVDLAAFMVGFSSHDPSADRNVDGAWDQMDIDIWEEEFARDSTP